MPDINLTQAEANALIAMEKHSAYDQSYDYPAIGGSICVPLVSPDKRENFLLDVSRGRIDLQKRDLSESGSSDCCAYSA
jgi:hypothetical protein